MSQEEINMLKPWGLRVLQSDCQYRFQAAVTVLRGRKVVYTTRQGLFDLFLV